MSEMNVAFGSRLVTHGAWPTAGSGAVNWKRPFLLVAGSQADPLFVPMSDETTAT